jgi:phosphopantetheinyl transferase (holo-ACP synthase)
MLGDDVVDLGDPEAGPGAQHPRFDARVFSPRERAALAASPAPHRLRWALWAAKEAAYKLARKLDPGARFSPRRYAVGLDARRPVRVAWPGGAARVEVRQAGDAVHATATEIGSDAARVVRGVARLEAGDDPSRAARELAVRRVAERLGIATEGLRVERRGRIPRLCLPDGGALDLSLSHHGRLVAFACELDRPGRPR